MREKCNTSMSCFSVATDAGWRLITNRIHRIGPTRLKVSPSQYWGLHGQTVSLLAIELCFLFVLSGRVWRWRSKRISIVESKLKKIQVERGTHCLVMSCRLIQLPLTKCSLLCHLFLCSRNVTPSDSVDDVQVSGRGASRRDASQTVQHGHCVGVPPDEDRRRTPRQWRHLPTHLQRVRGAQTQGSEKQNTTIFPFQNGKN